MLAGRGGQIPQGNQKFRVLPGLVWTRQSIISVTPVRSQKREVPKLALDEGPSWARQAVGLHPGCQCSTSAPTGVRACAPASLSESGWGHSLQGAGE